MYYNLSEESSKTVKQPIYFLTISLSPYHIHVYSYNHATLYVTTSIQQPNEMCVRRPAHLPHCSSLRPAPPCMYCAPFRPPRTFSLKNFSLLSLSRKWSTSFVLVHYPSQILSYVQRTELRWAPDPKTESLLSILAAHSFGHPPYYLPVSPIPILYVTTNTPGHIIATVISHVAICCKLVLLL